MIDKSFFKEGEISSSTYVRKTDEEIKKLAVSLYQGEIFTSLQISEPQYTYYKFYFYAIDFIR